MKKLKTLIYFLIIIFILFCNKVYAEEINIIKCNSTSIDYKSIIQDNTKNEITQRLNSSDEDLEYITKYVANREIPKGNFQLEQEGVTGTQEVFTIDTFEGNKRVNSEEIGSKVKKSSIDKIVKIGIADYTDTYKAKVGDTVYITPTNVKLKEESFDTSEAIVALKKGDKCKILSINDNWYKVSFGKYKGWVKSDYVTNLNAEKISNLKSKADKNKILKNVKFDMALNKKSGLTIDDFHKILSNEQDDFNNIFEDNSEYFYYIEQQYNINGVFIAAIGIHESNWGTSSIAKSKKNLFGYGAYDRSPGKSAYEFEDYSEGIDLIARVLTKSYLNPKGTEIYDGELATGTYYNGNTLSAVNKKYASDSNWAKSVYKWMEYLYKKL